MPKIRYLCVWCDSIFLTAITCGCHEVECSFNPRNKKCESCQHILDSIPGDDITSICAHCDNNKNWIENKKEKPDQVRIEKFFRRKQSVQKM